MVYNSAGVESRESACVPWLSQNGYGSRKLLLAKIARAKKAAVMLSCKFFDIAIWDIYNHLASNAPGSKLQYDTIAYVRKCFWAINVATLTFRNAYLAKVEY